MTGDVNQTKIKCTDHEQRMASAETSSSVTTVQVVRGDNNSIYPQSPELNSTKITQYGSDNATVVLTWIPENDVSYDVSVNPSVDNAIRFIKTTSIEVALLYNTPYTVTITATLCGDNSVSSVSNFNIGKF